MPLYAIRQMKNVQNSIPSLDDFCEIRENEKGEPTVFIEPRTALILDSLTKRFGQTIFQSSKMSGLQSLGASSKLEKGLKGAFAKDIIDQKVPWLSLLDHFAGINVKSYIAKNPDAALNLLSNPSVQKIIANFQGKNSPGSGNRSYGAM